MKLNNVWIDLESSSLEEYIKADAEFTKELYSEIDELVSESERREEQNMEFLDRLEIPYGYQEGVSISMNELVSILNDEKKLKKIISTLKNKAFW